MPAKKLPYLEMMKDQVANAIVRDDEFMQVKTSSLDVILMWLEARRDDVDRLESELYELGHRGIKDAARTTNDLQPAEYKTEIPRGIC